MNFEQYMVGTIKRLQAGEPVDRDLWNTYMTVYLDLIRRGVKPAKARKAMKILMLEN